MHFHYAIIVAQWINTLLITKKDYYNFLIAIWYQGATPICLQLFLSIRVCLDAFRRDIACASRASNCTFKLRVNELRASDNEVYRPAGHDGRRRRRMRRRARRRHSDDDRKFTQQPLRGDDSHTSRASRLFAQTADLLTTDATTSGGPESFSPPMQRRHSLAGGSGPMWL